MLKDAARIHAEDNVAVALRPLAAGESALGVALTEPIPAGHKFALRPIAAGQPVLKYGFPIGAATAAIGAGAWVHSHNLQSILHDDLNNQTPTEAGNQNQTVLTPPSNNAPTFMGYRRPDGSVGIRNEIWIINTVGCVNQASSEIARRGHAEFAGKGVDGVYAFTHPYGCSQLGDDLYNTQSVLAGLIRHPNAGAVLILGLGCENNQMKLLLRHVGPVAEGRVLHFNTQDVGDEIEAGLDRLRTLAAYATQFKREPVPASELILGMKCGGSDGLSGITANPLVGRVADRLTRLGGTALITEVPEMFGAEPLLLRRAAGKGVFDSTVRLVNDFRGYFRRYNEPIDENPSPGNKDGGITTLAEKSLGCVQKAGTSPIKEVLAYGQRAPAHAAGVCLVNSPGNDGVSATALTIAGAHMVLFTTGRGTPLGFPAPTLKIATNTPLALKKPGWIDFNAGVLAEQETREDAVTNDLFQLVLNVASGQNTRNELNANREIAIWKNGVTL